jgi:hypothetical protein
MSLGNSLKKILGTSTEGGHGSFGHGSTELSTPTGASTDLSSFLHATHANAKNLPGTPALMSSEGLVSPLESAGGGGKNTHTTTTTTITSATVTPAPTLVGSSTGLQIKLIWDASVGAMGSAMTAFENAAIAAAKFYTTMYSNRETINIQVGFGEVAGQALPSGALAASESYGYLENYSTVATALRKDASWSAPQNSADATLPVNDPTNGGKFFVTTAEAKALGQVGASSAVDGYIGLSKTYAFSYNGTAQVGKYDAIGALEHEISEVMGRVGSLGRAFGSNIYTPLDLFRYTAPLVRDLSPGPGYLSTNNGVTNLGTYNNPLVNGGDYADWGPLIRGDSYGYGTTNTVMTVSANDIIENSVMGYRMTNAGLAAAHTTGVAVV